MLIIQFLLLVRYTSSELYKDKGARSVSKTRLIHEENDVPSKLTCIQKCLRFQADALYEGFKCACVKKKQDDIDDEGDFMAMGNEAPMVTGIYYSQVQVPKQSKTTKQTTTTNVTITTNVTLTIAGMKQIIISTEERAIRETKAKLMTTLDKLTRQYVIYVEINPTRFDGTIRDVIQLTNRAERGEAGSRMPLIQFVRNRKGGLRFCTTLNGDPDFCFIAPKSYPYKKYSAVKISQLKQNGAYVFTIAINKEQVFSAVNDLPEEIPDMRVYIGSPEEKARIQSGFVRHFRIAVEE